MKKDFSNGKEFIKGYCLVEYFSAADGEKAFEKLDNLRIGDKNITVKKIEKRK